MIKLSQVQGCGLCLVILVILLGAIGLPSGSEAATVILRSGEKFTSPKVWKEGSTVKFYLHGIVVGVPGTDVQKIIDTPASSTLETKKDGSRPPVSSLNANKKSTAATTRSLVPGPVASRSDQKQRLARKPHTAAKTTGPPSRIDHLPWPGLRWKMRPAALGKLVRVKTENLYGGIVQYAWQDKPLRWAKIELDGLTFGFWRNQLYCLTMWVYGPPRFKRLRQEAFARYGRVRSVKKGSPKYIWRGKQTDALLEFDHKLNTGIFWFRSRALDELAKRLQP